MKAVMLATTAICLSLSAFAIAAENPDRMGQNQSNVQQQQASTQQRSEFQRLNDEFAQAFNKGDIRTAVNLYADDAVVLPPGSDILRNRAQIQSFWEKTSETMGDARLTTIDVRMIGSNVAREVGTFTLRTKGPQSSTTSVSSSQQQSQNQPGQEISGKYVVLWEKEGSNNQWRLTTDIWNTNK